MKRITILLIISLVFHSCKNTKMTSNNQEYRVTSDETKIDKNLPTTTIKNGQKIVSPITITINSEGIWFASEGELGIAKIVDEKNKILNIKDNIGILFSVDGNWMHTKPAFFKTTIAFDKKNAKKGKIIFYSNPGNGDGDEKGTIHSFEIPVIF